MPKIINKDLTEIEMRNALIEKAKEYNVVVLVPSFAMSKYWEEKYYLLLIFQMVLVESRRVIMAYM